MVIRFLVNNIHTYNPDGWMPDAAMLSGTEESIVEWAYILSRKYKVQVFSNFISKEPFEYRGATYYPRNQYLEQVGKKNGITVNVKSYDIEPVEPSVYLTNETNAHHHNLENFKYCILPSQWAVDNIPVNTETRIVPHGFDPDQVYPSIKVKKQCLYSSSPDRGLSTLELIWPSVVQQHPDAHLIVTYGGTINAPNVTCVGEVSNSTINRLYQTSDIWLHPCNGGELYGMSAIKAQAAEAIPVYFPTMALSETVQVGVKCTDPRDMYKKLVDLLDNETLKKELRNEMRTLNLPNWEVSTALLENVILETL